MAVSQLVEGNFEYQDKETMALYKIQLLDSSKFIKSSTIFLGHGSHFEQGNYTQKGDTVILQFEPYNRPKSYLKVISKDTLIFDKWIKIDPSNSTMLSISLYENEEIPLNSFASLLDLVSMNSIVATLSTDEKGTIHFSTTENFIDELSVRSLGFEQLKIPLRDFKGFRSKINAYLIPEGHNTYRETTGIAKYLLSNHAESLQFIEDDNSLSTKYSRVK